MGATDRQIQRYWHTKFTGELLLTLYKRILRVNALK